MMHIKYKSVDKCTVSNSELPVVLLIFQCISPFFPFNGCLGLNDLVVIISEDLKIIAYCRAMEPKGFRTIRSIRRVFSRADAKTFLTVFVRLELE